MATAQENKDIVKCAICLEQYDEPKKLPNCGHSFCETCIITYVSKYVENSKKGEEVPCPFCRVTSRAPRSKDEIPDWVKSLERNENILIEVSSDEVKSVYNFLCDSCHVFGISMEASNFCHDCFEVLCLPCSVGRHSIKMYQSHKLTDLEAKPDGRMTDGSLKAFRLLREFSLCSLHPKMELRFYCKDENCCFCSICSVTNHRQCLNIVELDGNALEKETRDESRKLKESIVRLSAFAKSITGAITKIIDDNKKEITEIGAAIEELRTKVNKLMDKIEERTKDQAKAIEKEVALSGERDNKALHEAICGLETCLSLIEKANECGVVRHTYPALKKLKQTFRNYEQRVLAIADTFKNVGPELTFESSLKDFVGLEPDNINTVANVAVKHHMVDLPLYESDTLLRSYNITKTSEKGIT